MTAPIAEAVRRAGGIAATMGAVWPHLEQIAREAHAARQRGEAPQFPEIVAPSAAGIVYTEASDEKVLTKSQLKGRLRRLKLAAHTGPR